MAFNPFDVFRRNQKILFALLTVFIMIMFTLSFGQGDLFTSLPNWVGAKTRKGETLAVIDGSKVTQADLQENNKRRQLANAYMTSLANQALQNTQQYVRDGVSRVSAEKRPAIEGALRSVEMLQQFGNMMANNPQIFSFVLQQFQQAEGQLQLILADKSPKATDLDIAQSAQSMLGMALQRATSFGRLYFDNQPNSTTRDQVDFVLWQKKADRLGITLTDADVAQLIVSEFSNRVSNADLAEAEQPLRNAILGYRPVELKAALVEEFRVRAAQQVVLGQNQIRAGGRSFEPPYDFYKFYKKQTTPAQFGLISLPAEAYMAQVTTPPTESQLQKLFNESRNIEPDPASPRPALREPRRLKLAWIEARGDEPFYKKAAASTLPQIELQAKLAFAIGLPLGFPTLGSTAGSIVPLMESDLTLQAKYKTYESNHESIVASNWFSTPFFGSKPLDTEVIRVPQMVSLTVAFANAALSYGGPFGPAATLSGEAYANSLKARAQTIPALTLAPILPGSWAPNILTTIVSQTKAIEPLPLSAVRSTLTEETQNELAKQLTEADLKAFGTELEKLGAKDDKTEANAYVAKMVAERGWANGASTEFRDKHTIMTDPGLAPLKEKFNEQAQFSRFTPGGSVYVNPTQFGQVFFEQAGSEPGRSKPAESFYKIERFPEGAALPSFQVWRTEQQEGETLKDIRNPIVRAKVEDLWRRLEARKLAKQAAEELAKECSNLGKSFIEIEMNLRDKAAAVASKVTTAAQRPAYFELTNVAPLVAPDFPMLSPGGGGLSPYRLAPSAFMPYPTFQMRRDLLEAKDKPLSTAIVLVDQPEEIYYVAVVLNRQEKTLQSFADLAYGSGVESNMTRRAVDDAHQFEIRKQARDAAVALLKAELGYEKENDKLLDDKNVDMMGFE